jgi:tRNA threonylcarbamoyl adenosine modification protein (Sua5/YciO/YrdC/YwlC family)
LTRVTLFATPARVLISVHPETPEPRKVRRAVEALGNGELIAYPTDTIYGIGCDLLDGRAVEQLYTVKRMPRTHRLALVCPELSDIARYAQVDNDAFRVLRRVLPGPYTFILEATREVPRRVQHRHKRRTTIGVRVPAHPVPIAIARALGRPFLTTSAQPPGEPPLTDARDIAARWPAVSLVLDGGPGGDQPTTVIDLAEGQILREGAGPVDELL